MSASRDHSPAASGVRNRELESVTPLELSDSSEQLSENPTVRKTHRDFYRPIPPGPVDSATDPTLELIPPGGVRLPSTHYCGQGAIIGCNPERSHVVIIPIRCKAWDCPTCGPQKRAAWILKLASGEPEREITLTMAPDPNLTARDMALAMKKGFADLVRKIRKAYGTFEYALVWELTKKGTPHCHVLFRGSYIPKRWLSAQWEKLGFGPVTYIQSVKGERLHAAHACKYLAKATGQSAMELAPLRIAQVSQNYVLEKDPKPTTDRYAGYTWHHTSSSPDLVAEPFLRSYRYYDSVHLPNGTVEVFLEPSPLPTWADTKDVCWWAFPEYPTLENRSGLSPRPLTSRSPTVSRQNAPVVDRHLFAMETLFDTGLPRWARPQARGKRS